MKIQLTFRISESLKKDLEKLAKDDNRPLSNYLETLLNNHVVLQKQLSVGKK